MMMLFRRRSERATTDRDAEQMIRDLGQQAYFAAGELAWREDAGLLASPRPGHWHRVQTEIGRRLGRTAVGAVVTLVDTGRKPQEQLAGLQ